MDRVVTTIRQKETEEIFGRGDYIRNIQSLVSNCTSFCIYGPTGVGKSFLLKHALHGFSYIELSHDLAKNMDRLRDTSIHVVVEEMSVTEPLTKGSTIVVSDAMMEEFECMRIEPLSVASLVELGSKKHPDVPLERITLSAESSNGDVRAFLFHLEEFTHSRDVFKTPKEFVYDLVCRNGSLEARDYIGSTVTEHGYTWGIIHENYVDAPGVDCARIADLMSLADIKDEELYACGHTQGSIFSMFGIVLPALEINHALDRGTMRPGSAWTKFNNYKMRHRKYQELYMRTKIDVDALSVISEYCKKQPNDVMPLLQSYGLESPDIDLMNHISIINKVKPRVLQNIKTKLKLLNK